MNNQKPSQPTRDAKPGLSASGLLAFYVPEHLAEDFDNFVVMGIAAIDGVADRKDWTQNERDIVEWLEQDRHKANDPDKP